ncbi:MAG TPA: hypothetical protein VLT58_12260 [Polyangia bacterium]|nr:hypothetical protein [Polyangia bacterium]
MAITSVTDPRHRAGDGQVKSESEFGEARRTPWWRRSKAEPQPAPVEHSTFPNPGAPTQAIPQIPPAAPKPRVLYRERPIDIDRAGYNIIGLLALAGREKWAAGRVLQEIDEPLEVLRRIKAQEDADAQKLLDRSGSAAAAPGVALDGIRNVVAAQDAANELPGVAVTADVDAGALGSELTAVTSNASALSDETMTFAPITPGMADPRVKVSIEAVPATAAPSPVQVPGEDLRPAIPGERVDADPGASSPVHPWDGVVRSDGSAPPSAPLSAAEVQPAIPEGERADPKPLPRRKAAASMNGRVAP